MSVMVSWRHFVLLGRPCQDPQLLSTSGHLYDCLPNGMVLVVFDSRLGSSSRLVPGEQWLTGLSRSDFDRLGKYGGCWASCKQVPHSQQG